MIYIVLPLYNKESNLEEIVERIRNILTGVQYKIIAIDDGGGYNLLYKLHQLKSNDFIIHSHKVRMGMGVVMAVGFNKVLVDAQDTDILVTVEPAYTASLEVIKELIWAVRKGNDIVIASHYKKDEKYINFPFLSRILSRIFSIVVNSPPKIHFSILDIYDYTIFLRAYRIGIIKEAVKYFGRGGLIQSRGIMASVEILIKLSLFAKSIKEIPYRYDLKDNKPRLKILSTIKEYFFMLIYLKRLLKKMEKLKKTEEVKI